MKIDLPPVVTRSWRALSAVPGWPDAPLAVRLRRMWPALLPAAGMLLLAGWNWGVRDPYIQAERDRHADVVQLDAEVSTLRLTCSDQQAALVDTQAESAAATLFPAVDQVAPYLRQLGEKIRAAGWEAVFQAYDQPADDVAPDAALVLIGVRGELKAVPGNPAPFVALLDVLGLFSTPDRRIDLTRLGVRADESGKLVVDFNLRLGCRVHHEKTTQ